ncbi:hypothetical protein NDU88_001148 [Pleurodeles waltl]|uniref:Uncharacterized protein n=1 Tax=Pleurodeles waltl TaxID=8319 RepID=A0AAV7SC59_PLEWA|nr:hypothetical protein NDU88_001148 [Pleurodeles waltl]
MPSASARPPPPPMHAAHCRAALPKHRSAVTGRQRSPPTGEAIPAPSGPVSEHHVPRCDATMAGPLPGQTQVEPTVLQPTRAFPCGQAILDATWALSSHEIKSVGCTTTRATDAKKAANAHNIQRSHPRVKGRVENIAYLMSSVAQCILSPEYTPGYVPREAPLVVGPEGHYLLHA